MLLLLFILLSFLPSCQLEQDTISLPSQNTLRLNLYTEPPTLDPRRSSDTTSSTVLQMLFEGLTRIEENEHPSLAMAQSVDISEDGTKYTFKLRDALWSNGQKVTAHDFLFSWKWSISPKHPAELAHLLYVIKNAKKIKEGVLPENTLGVKVIDDETLEVQLEHPAPYFLELLARPVFFPLLKNHTQSNPNWAIDHGPNYVGNGPFVLKEWRHHDTIVLDKSTTYWDKEVVQLESIRLYMVEDSNTELNMFYDGEIDYVGKPISVGPPTDAIPALRKRNELLISPFSATYFLFLNTDHPILSNLNIRKALAFAIDRHGITEHITQAGEIPALRFIPESSSGTSTPLIQDNDALKAKQYLQKGLQELNIKFSEFPILTFSYNTNEAHHKIAQAIQQQWRNNLGIRVRLENLEWKVYLSKLRTQDFEIGRLSWLADFNDPLAFLELFEESEIDLNSSGWEDPEFQKLLLQARSTLDHQKRSDLLSQAEEILMDEVPAIPLFFLTNSYLKSNLLHGETLSITGTIEFKKAYFK